MNNFASYYYADMLVLAVKKKKKLHFDQEQGEKWNSFSNESSPSWYKWHSKVARDFAQSFA